jgi:hypothetical protein
MNIGHLINDFAQMLTNKGLIINDIGQLLNE